MSVWLNNEKIFTSEGYRGVAPNQDKIDLALSPEGINGDRGDYEDRSIFRLTVLHEHMDRDQRGFRGLVGAGQFGCRFLLSCRTRGMTGIPVSDTIRGLR